MISLEGLIFTLFLSLSSSLFFIPTHSSLSRFPLLHKEGRGKKRPREKGEGMERIGVEEDRVIQEREREMD